MNTIDAAILGITAITAIILTSTAGGSAAAARAAASESPELR